MGKDQDKVVAVDFSAGRQRPKPRLLKQRLHDPHPPRGQGIAVGVTAGVLFVAALGGAVLGRNATVNAVHAGPVVDVECTGDLAQLNGQYFNDLGRSLVWSTNADELQTHAALSSIAEDIGAIDDHMLLAFLSRPVGRGGVPLIGGMTGDTCTVRTAADDLTAN